MSGQEHNLQDVPVVIFCGGRLVSLPGQSPNLLKGLVKIKDETLLEKIIHHYQQHGAKRFVLSAGAQLKELQDVGVSLAKKYGIQINVVDTGAQSSTGQRLARVREQLGGTSHFAVTYSDTYSDVDLCKVYREHLKSNAIATLVAAHVPTRFRILGMRPGETHVRGFATKPVVQNDWINGGFYFFQSKLFSPDYLDANNPKIVLEETVLENLAKNGMLQAFPFEGTWQHLDSERDLEILSRL